MRKQSRILWSDEEKQRLAKTTAQYLYDDPINGILPCFQKAMEKELEPSMRRDIKALTTVPWLRDMVYEALDHLKNDRVLKLEADFDSLSKLSQEQKKLVHKLETRINTIEPSAAMEVVLANYSISDLAMHMSRAAMDSFIIEQMEAQEILSMKPIVTTRSRKLRVVVAGLLSGQSRLIESKFDKAFDLKFWGSTQSIASLKACVSNVDHVVVLTKFISHSVTDVTSKHNHILVSGGLSSLRETLLSLSSG